MDKYLAIITTALVITQIMRLAQNTVQLRRQKAQIEYTKKRIQDIESKYDEWMKEVRDDNGSTRETD